MRAPEGAQGTPPVEDARPVYNRSSKIDNPHPEPPCVLLPAFSSSPRSPWPPGSLPPRPVIATVVAGGSCRDVAATPPPRRSPRLSHLGVADPSRPVPMLRRAMSSMRRRLPPSTSMSSAPIRLLFRVSPRSRSASSPPRRWRSLWPSLTLSTRQSRPVRSRHSRRPSVRPISSARSKAMARSRSSRRPTTPSQSSLPAPSRNSSSQRTRTSSATSFFSMSCRARWQRRTSSSSPKPRLPAAAHCRSPRPTASRWARPRDRRRS